MKKHMIMNGKKTYKANLHCHTTVSDGRHTPEEIKAIYTAKGYSIVAFTDHNVLKSQEHLNDDGFLAINSCEVDINQKPTQGMSTYHLNLYATRPDMKETPPLPRMDYHDIDAINQYIADRVEEGFIVCYNHPYWSMQTYDDYTKLQGCFAMEIYNHGCEVDDGCYGNHTRVYDEMLQSGQRLFCVSTDDNHNRGPAHLPDLDSFGGFTHISSKSLKYEDVMAALKNGDFYSSQGPEIYEISIDGDNLTVKCSPVQSIMVLYHGRSRYEAAGDGLTEATFKLRGNEGYIRVVCRDKNKNDANSNAYWL